MDHTLITSRLGSGRYALRPQIAANWYVYGPVSDEHLDQLLTDGPIDRQHNGLPT